MHDQSQPEPSESVGLCQKAIQLARSGETLYLSLAQLLNRIQSEQLWTSVGATSFKQFVQDHVRLKEATARQILKVHNVCEELGIPQSQVEELGWSKLAEVSSRMTAENKEALLKDIAQLSTAELRKKYKPTKQSASKPKSARQTIVWTEEIEEALRQAARFTKSNDLQVNLEYIAYKFKSLTPESPDRTARFSPN